ncbi:dockerin type I domain-containing protein [Candidatus Dojkabacteria bacterium]|jgi:hypothetical protein|nr:dockerin type I domain-containing protein [Candidatus Dojkabacteria bacterium]
MLSFKKMLKVYSVPFLGIIAVSFFIAVAVINPILAGCESKQVAIDNNSNVSMIVVKESNGSFVADTTTIILGDVDLNGEVNIVDLVSLVEYTNKMKAMDVNSDGVVNDLDVTALIDRMFSN